MLGAGGVGWVHRAPISLAPCPRSRMCRWAAEEGSADVLGLISNDVAIVEEGVQMWEYAFLCRWGLVH